MLVVCGFECPARETSLASAGSICSVEGLPFYPQANREVRALGRFADGAQLAVIANVLDDWLRVLQGHSSAVTPVHGSLSLFDRSPGWKHIRCGC